MGLPIDVWAPLWHVNMDLFREAGPGFRRPARPAAEPGRVLPPGRPVQGANGQALLRPGCPPRILPVHAQLLCVDDAAGRAVVQRRAALQFDSPEAPRAVDVSQDLYRHGYDAKPRLRRRDIGFLKGDGGILVDGTWMIGQFDAESGRNGRPLYERLRRVVPSRSCSADAPFVDGHAWVMPAKSAPTAATRSRRSGSWPISRTTTCSGHALAISRPTDPSSKAQRFHALPHRGDIAQITHDRRAPAQVRAAPVAHRSSSSAKNGGGLHRSKADRRGARGRRHCNGVLFHLLRFCEISDPRE